MVEKLGIQPKAYRKAFFKSRSHPSYAIQIVRVYVSASRKKARSTNRMTAAKPGASVGKSRRDGRILC
jgi:hypothetical protein